MSKPSQAEVRRAMYAQQVFIDLLAKEAARNPKIYRPTAAVFAALPSIAGSIGIAAMLDGLMSAYATICANVYADPRLRPSIGDPVAAIKEVLATMEAHKAAIDNGTPKPPNTVTVTVKRGDIEPVGRA